MTVGSEIRISNATEIGWMNPALLIQDCMKIRSSQIPYFGIHRTIRPDGHFDVVPEAILVVPSSQVKYGAASAFEAGASKLRREKWR